MINYNKNDLIDECLVRFYQTFQYTLDTCDYVPEKFNAKILAYIFKNMKRQFKKIDREDRRYQKALAQSVREEVPAEPPPVSETVVEVDENQKSIVEVKDDDKKIIAD